MSNFKDRLALGKENGGSEKGSVGIQLIGPALSKSNRAVDSASPAVQNRSVNGGRDPAAQLGDAPNDLPAKAQENITLTMMKSRVLQKLRVGDFVRVASVSRVSDPWLTEVVGRLGYDAIWFDMEHRSFGYNAVEQISLACRATGIDLMVRILKDGYTAPMRALEFGANGIMVPHCRNAEEARQWVEWTRFPPLGKRGFDGAGADADYALANPLEYLRDANEETFLMLQIEDSEAVACVDEIASVQGVDLLFVGPGDLSLSYGVPLQFDHALVQKAIDRVAEATAKAGNWWGMPTGSPNAAQALINRGARFIVCGGDHGALINGLRNSFDAHSGLRIEK